SRAEKSPYQRRNKKGWPFHGCHLPAPARCRTVHSMKRVFGIETEYGITVDGMESLDVVRESIEIVRSYTEHGASMKWDYDLEDPHQDARGFRAEELLQDTDEAAYFQIDANRPLSFEE